MTNNFKFIGRHELILGNTFVAKKELKPPYKEVPPQVDLQLWIIVCVYMLKLIPFSSGYYKLIYAVHKRLFLVVIASGYNQCPAVIIIIDFPN